MPNARVALVTGGTRGIGLAIADRLARDGFRVCVCGTRDAADVSAALESLRQHGTDVVYQRADVGDRAARAALVEAVRDRLGALHILVNNAGIAPTERRDLLEATEESFERLIRVNLQGPYFLTQAAARWMIDQKRVDPRFRGCIINIGSVSATTASVNRGEYCVSKAGLGMATRLWAARLGEWDIPVYEVRPGIIRTDMTAGVVSKYDRLIENGLLVQSRWGLPEDVASAVGMLARGDLAYSTGQVIDVGGGLELPRL